MFSIFSKFGTTVVRAIKPTLEKPLTRSLNTLPNVGSSEVGSLIKPTFKNIEGFTDYVDMTKQPTMGIVTRSFFEQNVWQVHNRHWVKHQSCIH